MRAHGLSGRESKGWLSLAMTAKIRRNAGIFRRQFRSIYFPALGQCRSALVRICLCAGVCFRLFRGAPALKARVLRPAA